MSELSESKAMIVVSVIFTIAIVAGIIGVHYWTHRAKKPVTKVYPQETIKWL